MGSIYIHVINRKKSVSIHLCALYVRRWHLVKFTHRLTAQRRHSYVPMLLSYGCIQHIHTTYIYTFPFRMNLQLNGQQARYYMCDTMHRQMPILEFMIVHIHTYVCPLSTYIYTHFVSNTVVFNRHDDQLVNSTCNVMFSSCMMCVLGVPKEMMTNESHNNVSMYVCIDSVWSMYAMTNSITSHHPEHDIIIIIIITIPSIIMMFDRVISNRK